MRDLRLLIAFALVLIVVSFGQSRDDSRRITPVPLRKALLIGNANYHSSPLRNPKNDVQDLGKSLARLGFKTEILTDSRKPQILAAARSFAGDLAPGDIGLFFYSGHGFQIDSENYLVPVDFSASTETQARDQSIDFREIKDALERTPAQLVIIILDSCRDNPFGKPGAERKGLALLEAGLGSYVVFAASPGKTASDNSSEKNGLFTKHLLLELPQPVAVSELFRRVRKEVFDASGGAQLPYLHDQMIVDVSLGVSPPPPPPPNSPPVTLGKPSEQIEDGKRLFHLGKCQEAANLFERLVRRDPENAFTHNALGLAYACLKMNSPAARSFSMAIELNPGFAAPYLNRGQVYLDAARFELAIQDFTWAIEQEPENGVFYWRRGQALFGLRRYEDARRDFDRAVELDPSDPNGYHGRGKLLHQLGKYREALADYVRAIELKRDTAVFYTDRALTRDRLGDSAGATADRAAAQRFSALN